MDTIRKVVDQKGSKSAIIQSLRLYGSMSRIELAQRTELSRATISMSIQELIELGIAHETETRQSTGGRRPTDVELMPNTHLVLGADLNQHGWMLGAFDLLGSTADSRHIPLSRLTPEAAFRALVDELPSFISKLDKSPMPLLGISLPGIVDSNQGVLRSSAVLGWQEVGWGSLFERELGWPTTLINRSRARGLTECRYGSGKEHRHMIYIGIDAGIGAGIYVDRELIHGAIGGAGEIGHTTVTDGGPLCPCGNTGCLQTLSAAQAIELEARRLLRSGAASSMQPQSVSDLQLLRAEHVCAAAEHGDELAAQIIEKAASYLGTAMANLVNLLNPESIILGGPIPKDSSLYVKTAEKVMRQRAMSTLSWDTEVKVGQFKEIGGALGAANFILDKHLSFSYLAP
ncbi:ROK family protein [Paenibacillus sp. UNC499MF]|uniref:ROK family transcriptional regulator n=1 Tax=Paenibacillus sp. UNC499MF TaxID=1502751 RepID=UPI0008A0656F|nr:ROK family protein [Paenibacillus sp. UNC499MF]SEG71293.1 Sugar kinase of the NBD/HSP70 family, may contain an N-terminal HTH domain [Paenibacillus sp. UNC499MF]